MVTRLDSAFALGANAVFATVANFGHSHVFRSTDGGLTWEDVDKGQLPDVPHHAIVVNPDESQTVFVANDVGVFVSTDGAKTWRNMTFNLPNVMVVDLVCCSKDRTLIAGTYGRSIWRIHI